MSPELMRVQCVKKAQFDLTTLTSSYQQLNGSGFSDTVKILKIYNPSASVAIDVSLDGIDEHDFIPPMGLLIVDFQANHSSGPTYGNGTLNVAKGQILWGKIASQPTFLQMVGYR